MSTGQGQLSAFALLFAYYALAIATIAAAGNAPIRGFSAQSIARRRNLILHGRWSGLHESLQSIPRGGSTIVGYNDEDDGEDEEDRKKKEEELKALKKYRMDQQILYQLRSTFLSEALAARGVPLATMVDVSTAEGDKPPESVDWDCALSTVDEPKPCLYSFDAEPNTKVVAPLGTDQWISLSALNRLRRTDPTKVEPMWHSQYSILKSWFNDESEYSLLQHVGFNGFFISSVLLDLGGGIVLKSLLVMAVLSVVIVLMPLLEYIINRFMVSRVLWAYWPTWSRFVRAGFPLKLLLGQMTWKFVARSFAKLEGKVRDYIVDVECAILEESTPLTVGPGSEVEEEDVDDFSIGGSVTDEEEEDADDYGEDDSLEIVSEEDESEGDYDEYEY